jgi:hypothetical protein
MFVFPQTTIPVNADLSDEEGNTLWNLRSQSIPFLTSEMCTH